MGINLGLCSVVIMFLPWLCTFEVFVPLAIPSCPPHWYQGMYVRIWFLALIVGEA